MIEDTLIVVLVCIMPAQQPKQNTSNRFAEAFEQSDKQFNKKYKMDIEALKRASREAAIRAFKETKNKLLKEEQQ